MPRSRFGNGAAKIVKPAQYAVTLRATGGRRALTVHVLARNAEVAEEMVRAAYKVYAPSAVSSVKRLRGKVAR